MDNGEWVYGYFLENESDIYRAYIVTSARWETDDDGDTDLIETDTYEVDPATVGQYTGLTDKNGKKIFKGDICDFTVFDCFDNDTQYRGVVVYAGSRFMLWKSVESEYYGADGGFDLDWVIAQDDEFEIVGNIHDNPDLLEKKEDKHEAD